MSILNKINRAESTDAAFASGIDSVIDAALDAHRNTARAFTALTADTLRAERLATYRRAYRDDDYDGDRLAFDERVQPYDV
jgi:hypothetical protein